jgi:hypothetical protein
VIYRLSTVGHDNEGTLATKVVDKQLEEGVDREGLEDVSNVLEARPSYRPHICP